MNICLKTCAKQDTPQRIIITLSERLPFHIVADCTLACDYFVTPYKGYYVLTLDVTGDVPVCCQRCLEAFKYQYANHTELAICRNEEAAEQLMESYECIVIDEDEVDLDSILTDELHLYIPEKHPELIDCNNEIELAIVNN